ncbi:RVP_2 domain-containing protein [Gossypium australe]|uniref:RVP_2 domain-containing protein n=1 Tax=Gossypium australe TaxID=47621 RepID=A0A5B6X5X3_9ROSI|nr:RVP_2 domain-containing protein [Gossypium australe]
MSVRYEAQSPARAYAIRAKKEATAPNVIVVGRDITVELTKFDIWVKLTKFDVQLTLYNVVVNCKQKRISLQSVDGEVRNVEVDRFECLTNIISTMSTHELIRKGWEVVSGSEIDKVPIVQEFTDWYPEKLLGLSLEREVEFAIEVAPGIASISIVPYKMTLIELKELKT